MAIPEDGFYKDEKLNFGGGSMALYWMMGLETAALGIAMAIGNDGGLWNCDGVPHSYGVSSHGLNCLPPNGDGCIRQVCSWWPSGGRALDRAPLRTALLLDGQWDGCNCQC